MHKGKNQCSSDVFSTAADEQTSVEINEINLQLSKFGNDFSCVTSTVDDLSKFNNLPTLSMILDHLSPS
ncbi:hypothetical protein H5410_060906 [Solanum commersonii]|uniref:Uncharacterized protein n=1 Tax=Solanum commersonii TaxID=4109 RepID=A0A9J5W7D7_SOLCO|nr:hypothetical protein H5410_060906 [Solanum commersonii]